MKTRNSKTIISIEGETMNNHKTINCKKAKREGKLISFNDENVLTPKDIKEMEIIYEESHHQLVQAQNEVRNTLGQFEYVLTENSGQEMLFESCRDAVLKYKVANNHFSLIQETYDQKAMFLNLMSKKIGLKEYAQIIQGRDEANWIFIREITSRYLKANRICNSIFVGSSISIDSLNNAWSMVVSTCNSLVSDIGMQISEKLVFVLDSFNTHSHKDFLINYEMFSDTRTKLSHLLDMSRDLYESKVDNYQEIAKKLGILEKEEELKLMQQEFENLSTRINVELKDLLEVLKNIKMEAVEASA